jgi:hypothetical protein
MQDNDLPAGNGFEENRQFKAAFVNGLTGLRGAQLFNTIISDDVVASQWAFDYTHKDWGVCNYKQISIQRWRDGKVIEENF